MSKAQRKYVIFGVLAAINIALDQWTKILARTHLMPLGRGRTKTVIEGFFDLRYSENTGVAFGMLQALPGGRFVLTLIAVAAFVLVLYYLRKTEDDMVRLQVALGFVGGGAIGNLIDRVLHGKVTDFIVWHYKGHEWPAFNIADAALVVGVALMAVDIFRGGKPARAEAASQQKGA